MIDTLLILNSFIVLIRKYNNVMHTSNIIVLLSIFLFGIFDLILAKVEGKLIKTGEEGENSIKVLV